MMCSRILGVLLVLGACSAMAMSRHAIVVGNNVGAPSRAKLWFAEKDASRFANTLKELGEIPAAHITLLQGAHQKDVKLALEVTEKKIRQAHLQGERTLLVFYFSGHAGDKGLELADERIEFRELRQSIENSSADVKVAIVDACESGNLTQVKGAKISNKIEFPLPADGTNNGVAYIASTAVGEPAQESAALGGSFFTFHLEAALRGAGDADGDKKVSLAEAFRYTASRTTTGTTTTEAGPQHPTYNFKMSGRGDVTLSDLRLAEATLSLPGDTRYSYLISDKSHLVAESPGGLVLGLPSGNYTVEQRRGNAHARAQIVLAKGAAVSVSELSPYTPEDGRTKGGEALTEILAGAQVSSPFITGMQWAPGGRIALWRALGPVAVRATFDYATAPGVDRGLSYRTHAWGLGAALLYPIHVGVFRFDVGVELGMSLNSQTLQTQQTYLAMAGKGHATGAATYRYRWFSVSLQASGGARLLPLNGVLTLRPSFEAAGLVGAAF